MIIRCRCGADPAGRWKQPPAIIFCDPYLEDGSVRDVPGHACRDHLSAKREEEIQRQEKGHWKKGELRRTQPHKCAPASSAASRSSASAISGISGVGEKPSSAGERAACASARRPVDW
jgi:hypothetical protein